MYGPKPAGLPIQNTCVFLCGYPSKNDLSKRLYANVKSIVVCDGIDTDLNIDKKVYDIEFELIKEW